MEQKKHNIGHFFFGRDKFDRIGQSAAFAALFNKLVHNWQSGLADEDVFISHCQ